MVVDDDSLSVAPDRGHCCLSMTLPDRVRAGRLRIECSVTRCARQELFTAMNSSEDGPVRCWVCRHPLTAPQSVELGVGPVCRRRWSA